MIRNDEVKVYDYVEKGTGIHVVKAVTCYEGKAIYAFAKCDPEDTFDYEFGKNLALKRLDLKVAEKRAAHAKEYLKFCETNLTYVELEKRQLQKAIKRAAIAFLDRKVEIADLETEIKELLETI